MPFSYERENKRKGFVKLNWRLFSNRKWEETALPAAVTEKEDFSLYSISSPAAFIFKTERRSVADGIIDLP